MARVVRLPSATRRRRRTLTTLIRRRSERRGRTSVASLSCCKSAGGSGSRSVNFTLCGVHLLWGGFVSLVSESLEALAFELGEADAVGGVADVEVEHGPDQRQAAGLAGEAADHLGAALDLTERAFEQVR